MKWCHLLPDISGRGWVCDRHGFYVYLRNHNRHHPLPTSNAQQWTGFEDWHDIHYPTPKEPRG